MSNNLTQCKLEPDSIAYHGMAFNIFNHGIVITGKSGIGKSEIGLELIDRGHQLICDDLFCGKLINQEIIIMPPQEFGIGFMEIRGIGFIDIKKLYGTKILCRFQKLFLIIELVDNNMLDLMNQDRLMQLIDNTNILGIKIPLYKLPIGANRNLPILIELIVKYAMAKESGYDSHQNFITQHFQIMQKAN